MTKPKLSAPPFDLSEGRRYRAGKGETTMKVAVIGVSGQPHAEGFQGLTIEVDERRR